MSYSEKLKDPQWQRKRLEILERDNFTCQGCQSTTKTLHIHHEYYVKDREPWNYPDFCYVTLCEDCHKFSHFNQALFERNYGDLCRIGPADVIEDLCGLIAFTIHGQQTPPETVYQALRRALIRVAKDYEAEVSSNCKK
jgi:hypothetical protein